MEQAGVVGCSSDVGDVPTSPNPEMDAPYVKTGKQQNGAASMKWASRSLRSLFPLFGFVLMIPLFLRFSCTSVLFLLFFSFLWLFLIAVAQDEMNSSATNDLAPTWLAYANHTLHSLFSVTTSFFDREDKDFKRKQK